ncbi:BZ3500_MvSof-1268-A1-R1_Chr6-3g08729 [Microbotryum saponariae]|uniref:BZ3500_MvSof-1268-A1-R1_Chr6-3g08729 protein n=1 Tax=Microbotryum saponariae TaxID=289078 RepID=A0A2X0MNV1_9BASI|nr:BZ3500_MvSof-1268-A1-R1_Chr6-3g08729 [Microbotryum saponariae]SDA07330.1 BZ3501_MvSof-1269-A2-R1_Chr6-2g08432 [Microbotryum saponariae]
MTNATSPILSCHPGSLNAFALKLKTGDSVQSIRARAARKLALHGDGSDIGLQYLWCDVYYTLEDEDDWEVFTDRHANSAEVTVLLTGPSIPTTTPSIASMSSLPPSSSGSQPNDGSSIYSGHSYGRGVVRDVREGTSMHLLSSSASSKAPSVARSAAHNRQDDGDQDTIGGKSKRTAKSIAPSVPEHKIKFEEFHNQLGVRTFIGSIGPVENVRMMMKAGHRACYMSRAFAQQHAFIPKDAAPGFYGFSGITNLGSWPIKVCKSRGCRWPCANQKLTFPSWYHVPKIQVGKKTVEQQVMLVENSYFPVILGRSFMERRGVRTDPLDQTSVVFMDTGEVIPTDLVIVKDAAGHVIPVS